MLPSLCTICTVTRSPSRACHVPLHLASPFQCPYTCFDRVLGRKPKSKPSLLINTTNRCRIKPKSFPQARALRNYSCELPSKLYAGTVPLLIAPDPRRWRGGDAGPLLVWLAALLAIDTREIRSSASKSCLPQSVGAAASSACYPTSRAAGCAR